ncbi:unnamed protein product [Rotaria sordida]|uniref:BZIP domain-containing protein n=1 Tax=Rotaria sordida TaxID=392033 RepID=A0A814F5J6_9BILA|nr:unnamed protein product [Rotaria sordida]CAF3714300.1 unnamed protein product [Rotaria sordida]
MDLEFSTNILDTPSLITPNISLNPLIYKISHTPTIVDVNNEDNHDLSTNPPSIITTTITNNESLSTSSNDIKLSKIEDDLKRTFTQPRKPTESLFQKMAKAGVLSMENVSIPSNIDDGIPVDVPSTAEVMNDLESFSKYSTQDNIERETTSLLTSDNNNHFDTSSLSSSHTMGVVVAPKKKLLQRTQSRTEPTSPTSITNNHFSQSHKTDLNDASSIDDDHQLSSNNDFQRLHDMPLLIHTIDSHPQLDNNLKPPYTIQLKTDQNGVHPTIIKQQPMTPTNKRTFQQTIVGGSISKANSILISQQPIINEATSSNQLLNIKRQKTIPIQTNTLNINSSFPSSSSTTTTPTTPPYDNNNNVGSDDQRKKQIRDSNREAARRCRERRRHYIEQLEGNLEQCKQQIKQLNEKLSHAERENTQLRAILTETKRFHSTSCLPSNESMLDFVNVITTNGIEINSDSTDGNIIPRNYFPRNTH